MRRLLKQSTRPITLYGSLKSLKFVLKMPGMYGFGSSGSIDLMNYLAAVSHIMAGERSSNRRYKTSSLRTRSPGMLMSLTGKRWMTRKTPMALMASSGGRLLILQQANLV